MAYDPAKHVRSLTSRIKKGLRYFNRRQGQLAYRKLRTRHWRRRLAEHHPTAAKKRAVEARLRESLRLEVAHERKLRQRKASQTKLRRALAKAKRAVQKRSSDRLWGGCRAVTNEVIRIVGPGIGVSSRKRVETYGNAGSDHHVSQRLADAVDFKTGNNYALARKIALRLGGSWSGDYDSFNIKRNGKWYRVQIIAGTHGTGPHLHVGVRRV